MYRHTATGLLLALVASCQGQCGDPDPTDSGLPDPTGVTETAGTETGTPTADPTGDTGSATGDTGTLSPDGLGVFELTEIAEDTDTRGLVLFGDPGEGVGRSVKAAGDINGDGIDDFVVGSSSSGRKRPGAGTLFVVFGPVDATAIDLSTIASNASSGFAIFGAEADDATDVVAGGGDVNNDGLDDLVIGAQFADTDIINEGKVFVVFGKTTGTPVDLAAIELDDDPGGFVIRGANRDDSTGGSVAIAGDVDNDGLDDLLIGASGADPNGNFSGTSYVVFGKADGMGVDLADIADPTNAGGYELRGASSGDVTGSAVQGVGDLDNDGLDDLVIGASATDFNQINASGAAYVVYGKADGAPVELSEVALDTDPRGYVIGGLPDFFGNVGLSIATGHLNGDNLRDLIIGAPGATFGGLDSGAAYVVFGKTGGTAVDLEALALDTDSSGYVIRGFSTEGPPGPLGAQAGKRVGSGGDVDGDGIDDIIVSTSPTYVDQILRGGAFVVFGKGDGTGLDLADLAEPDNLGGFELRGGENEFAGDSVDIVGDVDNDGFDDVMVGASLSDVNGDNSGAAYVIFGFPRPASP